jgi:N6-L-threonylcarbamoyladenine synthase
MLVLGIETTCDETAAAVVERSDDGTATVRANLVLSQIEEHAAFGGVVPEIAARAHVEALDLMIASAMAEARTSFQALDGIAAAAGPGLIGGVIVGLTTAKAIAMVHEKPLVAVNHLEAHALTARFTDEAQFPYCLFLASGGHTQIVAVLGVGDYVRLGTTRDDAVGEAFDKTAKLLGLGYPGGPKVEEEAARGDRGRFALPRPMIGRPDADFSLSGLKTALRLEAEKIAPLSDQDVADLCASFQLAVVEMIVDRLRHGLRLFRQKFGPPTALVAAGGVAANQKIRDALLDVALQDQIALIVPPPALCTDNAAMIAWAGAERLVYGLWDPLDTAPRARWPLDQVTKPAVRERAAKAAVEVVPAAATTEVEPAAEAKPEPTSATASSHAAAAAEPGEPLPMPTVVGSAAGHDAAPRSPSPLVGEGRGGGSGGDGTEVPQLPTPTPDPSPQGGGEKTGGGADATDLLPAGSESSEAAASISAENAAATTAEIAQAVPAATDAATSAENASAPAEAAAASTEPPTSSADNAAPNQPATEPAPAGTPPAQP